MRVLYFHQHFKTPSFAGGIRSYEFAQTLLKKGHKVTMVCGEYAKFNLAATKIKGVFKGNVDGIDVIQIALPYSNSDGILKRVFTFIKFAWKGIRIAMHEEYDLLFATSTPLTAGIPGIVAKIFRQKTFVFEVRDLWPELPKALGLKNPLLLLGMSLLEWLSYRYANACIGLSPGICDGIKRRSPRGRRIVMIPNGCDLELFIPRKTGKFSLEGIKESDKIAVFTGTHGIANGLNAVLDAASILKARKRDDIVLLFVGDGNMKEKLMARASRENLNNCRFLAPIPKKQLNQLISAVDMGMMVLANVPAFYYGTSPNKFFDYISAGLPIINNYPGWLADLIKENECGIVIPPDNAETFADALERLADNPLLRQQYGVNARKLAEMKFSREELANQFVRYLELINQNV